MTNHVAKGRPKQRSAGRGLSLLLLLPIMCAVIFFASRVGAGNFSSGVIERQVTPFETANYSPWNEIIFAPVDDGLLTAVGQENGDATVEYAGIATARPTIDRNPQVGVPPAIAQYITPLATQEVIVENPTAVDDVTEVAEASTAQNDASTGGVEPTIDDEATPTEPDTDTPVPTDTETDAPTETASPTDTATSTETPTGTASPTETATSTATPSPTATATSTATTVPTATNTPVPTATPTPIPTNTPVPPPNVNFSANPQTGNAPLTVTFTNLSSGNITSYNWNFGDGTTSGSASTTHTFTTPGSYYVRFDVSGPGGSAAAGVTINVNAAQTDTPVPPPPPTANPDSDGDTVPNDRDQCPNEGDQGYGVLGNGCPAPIPDRDNDGVPDDVDQCGWTGNLGYGVYANGCPIPPPDSDGDGYTDDVDSCPSQGDQGFGVDATGCPIAAPDGDGDGVPDASDLCPAQGDQGNGVDANGCPIPPPDADGDGVPDASDLCPAQGDQGYGVDANGCPNPPPSYSVTGLTVINTDTQSSMGALGSSITLSGNNRGIIAQTSGSFNSIVFRIDGTQIQVENANPYSIAGDGGVGAINFWNYPPGTYTLTATPYNAANGNGTPGGVYTIVITINP